MPKKPTKFQRDRASGIGGSDAPVLCGVARWRSPFQLWVEKTRAMAGEFEEDVGGEIQAGEYIHCLGFVESHIFKFIQIDREIITSCG